MVTTRKELTSLDKVREAFDKCVSPGEVRALIEEIPPEYGCFRFTGTRDPDVLKVTCWYTEDWYEAKSEFEVDLAKNRESASPEFPAISVDPDGSAIIRWASTLNPWMDFIVIVPKEFADPAADIVKKTMDEFWDQNDLCYGDMIEYSLNEARIPAVTVFHDADREDEAYEKAWETYIAGLGPVFKQII